MDDKKARLTILIDAERKKAFEEICAARDVTASQMVRQLIREYLDEHGVQYAPLKVVGGKRRRG
jgi:predicted transcriptional regulator